MFNDVEYKHYTVSTLDKARDDIAMHRKSYLDELSSGRSTDRRLEMFTYVDKIISNRKISDSGGNWQDEYSDYLRGKYENIS